MVEISPKWRSNEARETRAVLNFPTTLTTTTVVVLLLLLVLLLVFLLQFSCVLFVREIGRISFLRNEPFREYVTTRFFLCLSTNSGCSYGAKCAYSHERDGGGGRSGVQEQHQEHVVTTKYSTSTTINGTNKQRENRKQQQQQQLKVEGVHAKTINNRDRPRYKTRLCNSFRQEGTCRFGSACLFAHSNEELRKTTTTTTTTTSAVDLELQHDSNPRGNIDM